VLEIVGVVLFPLVLLLAVMGVAALEPPPGRRPDPSWTAKTTAKSESRRTPSRATPRGDARRPRSATTMTATARPGPF
jgi:hypothetical protein